MSIEALLQAPKALGERLREFVASTKDLEEGLSAHSYTHGFITAVVVGSEVIPPAEWIGRLMERTREQPDAGDAKLAMAMMAFEHSQIVKSFSSRDGYKPFFWEDSEGNLITKDWAYGFLAGIRLRGKAWELLQDNAAKSMFALLAVLIQNEEMDAVIVEGGKNPKELFKTAQDIMPEWLAALYTMRRERALDLGPQERKVGRNDPCPCGSGKKYKKCCLN